MGETCAFWTGQHFFTGSGVAFHRNAAQLFSVADALSGSKTTPAVAESHRGAKSWGHAEREDREETEKMREKQERNNFREREREREEESTGETWREIEKKKRGED